MFLQINLDHSMMLVSIFMLKTLLKAMQRLDRHVFLCSCNLHPMGSNRIEMGTMGGPKWQIRTWNSYCPQKTFLLTRISNIMWNGVLSSSKNVYGGLELNLDCFHVFQVQNIELWWSKMHFWLCISYCPQKTILLSRISNISGNRVLSSPKNVYGRLESLVPGFWLFSAQTGVESDVNQPPRRGLL